MIRKPSSEKSRPKRQQAHTSLFSDQETVANNLSRRRFLGAAAGATVGLSAEGGSRNKGAIRGRKPIENVDRPDHWLDWLQSLRSRRQCHAPIEAGYQHAVACIMARLSYDTGHRMVYDHNKREIRPG